MLTPKPRRREFVWAAAATAAFGQSEFPSGMTSGTALERLMAGNRRFAKAMAAHPDQSEGLRMALSSGQHPFAVVLTCSDSRVAPEILFDQGLGDLFVIRVAGNIVDDAVIGSIEYATAHLQVPLVFVLGHQKCGAVQAALGEEPEAHIKTLATAIRPAVAKARALAGDVLDNSVRENARFVASQLSSSRPILADRIDSKKLIVAAGYYELGSGIVTSLD